MTKRLLHSSSIAIFAVLFVGLNNTPAQIEFGFELIGGMSSMDEGIDQTLPDFGGLPSGIGAGAGVFLAGPIEHKASVRSGLLARYRSLNYDSNFNSRVGTVNVMMINLQLPVLLVIRATNGIQLGLGPSLNVPIQATSLTTGTNTSSNEDYAVSNGFRSEMKGFGISFLVEGGYHFKNGVEILLRLDQGVSSILNKEAYRSVTLQDVLLCLHYDLNASARAKSADSN